MVRKREKRREAGRRVIPAELQSIMEEACPSVRRSQHTGGNAAARVTSHDQRGSLDQVRSGRKPVPATPDLGVRDLGTYVPRGRPSTTSMRREVVTTRQQLNFEGEAESYTTSNNKGAGEGQLQSTSHEQDEDEAAEERDVDKAMRVVQVLAGCVGKCCEEQKEMRDEFALARSSALVMPHHPAPPGSVEGESVDHLLTTGQPPRSDRTSSGITDDVPQWQERSVVAFTEE